jgi:transcriptional regulator with GAF, ATPase, and Fis domain
MKRAEPRTLTLDDFRSTDPAMQKCLDLARLAARTDLPILIVGESGTGKSLLARAIHDSSKRIGGAFVAFNAAALSDTLLDSQLFGHERGAFTGAERTVRGKFELAHGGTLFLDEIADMTPAAQAKILRAIELGEFERLGSETLQRADVRVISATHWPLDRFVASERFRKDLFYRVSGITLSIPPLRDRPGDLRALIASEITLAAQKEGKSVTGLDRIAADRLLSYSWPGNLRELKTVVHTAVALSAGRSSRLTRSCSHRPRRRSPTPAPMATSRSGRSSSDTFKAWWPSSAATSGARPVSSACLVRPSIASSAAEPWSRNEAPSGSNDDALGVLLQRQQSPNRRVSARHRFWRSACSSDGCSLKRFRPQKGNGHGQQRKEGSEGAAREDGIGEGPARE